MSKKLSACLSALAFLAGLASAPGTPRAEFVLSPGDVIEISVYRVPELSRRVRVGLDGNILILPIGKIKVADLTLEQVQARIREELVRTDAVRNPEVAVELFEAQPVYVRGDVAKPGAYPYSAGLTVRQAIALAGDVEILGARTGNPTLATAELRAEQEVLQADHARELVRRERAAAELNGRSELDPAALAQAGVPDAELKPLIAEAERRLKLRQADHANEVAHVERLVANTREQLAKLEEQHRQEEAAVRQQQEDLTKLRSLSERGLAVINRVTEEQRAIGYVRTQMAQTATQIAAVERSLEELARRRQKLDDDRRMELLAEVQDATLRLDQLHSRLHSTSERLALTGAYRSQWLRRSDQPLGITIHRQRDGKAQALAANEDAAVRPGDVIEIVLPLEK